MKKVLSHQDGAPTNRQHFKPCLDCPWRRDAAPGWLGELSADEWVTLAHGEGSAECHVHHTQQCAGLAVYRANVCKAPRNPALLRLPADRRLVFGTPDQFLEYHRGGNK